MEETIKMQFLAYFDSLFYDNKFCFGISNTKAKHWYRKSNVIFHVPLPLRVDVSVVSKNTQYQYQYRQMSIALYLVLEVLVIVIVFNDITSKSHEQRLIIKEHIATHTNLILLF